MLKPRRLGPGARIAVVAPASPFQRVAFDEGVTELQRLGFEPVWDESVFARDAYLAGSAERRAAALVRHLEDPSVHAIIAARGGYGSAQLLPLLDRDLIRRALKPIIGYSDITSLLSYTSLLCGVVSFHGPMLEGRLAKGDQGYDRASFLRAVTSDAAMGEFDVPELEVIVEGEVAGPILGGTVTQLLGSLGTPYAFDPPHGYVLFFDEVAERPYRLDRMVTQLRQSGLLARASAVVIGELPRCDEPGGEVTGRGVVARLLADFPGPVIAGFPSGHTSGPQHTIPFGVRARVVGDRHRPRVVIEESAVQ